ncbi:GNAT family N-acetyltransferase [Ramlibacter rhizophilus]|uniref:N-acetyltransferase n=1 Tax=Ramlibacter rhizophilus TaxID=1781167 RepID=A0A4Z0BZN4_9BURK|nr:GNAT family N-acetyltransferase [Ramlibacter rhizophilus]TFZ04713.1 N-acetyltransferase [Ramlibacter rhizophilus]
MLRAIAAVKKDSKDYVIRVSDSPAGIPRTAWNSLLQSQGDATPFMRHEYLDALHASGSATPESGWTPAFIGLWRGDELHGACALYLKDHSYGEYVFDWAWANAYEQHGLAYYPKALVAVPFTPVPGPRLLARSDAARDALVQGLLSWCRRQPLSSLHLLFLSEQDAAACDRAGLMARHTVQFHWLNAAPGSGRPYADFDEFLASLAQDKRKKIRQERRKVAEAGVEFRVLAGAQITPADWDFFYRCYARTYREHGNAPYLTRDFFRRVAHDMPGEWVLFVATREGRPIACSLVAVDGQAAYGRYWGALERVDCLHFDTCYYQPIEWCIAQGLARFEGGAQGEHKMARALMPVRTTSAHWLAHPAFSDAVERFLEREDKGIGQYLEHLALRSPFRRQDDGEPGAT